MQLLFTLGVRADPVGADRAFPRHPRHPVEPADVLVLCDADHLPVPVQAPERSRRRFLNLNPFAHLAILYQEILFFPGPFGHWKWLLALGVASVVLFLVRLLAVRSLRDSFAEEV